MDIATLKEFIEGFDDGIEAIDLQEVEELSPTTKKLLIELELQAKRARKHIIMDEEEYYRKSETAVKCDSCGSESGDFREVQRASPRTLAGGKSSPTYDLLCGECREGW